jgi:hypothetical protein
MGIRGELFSSRVSCNGRTYFFNVKENRMGDMFLTVVESKPNESEGFERRSIVVFREDIGSFVKAFQDALSFMEKPGAAKEPLGYAPAESATKSQPRRARTPEGFAGSEIVPKRRIVVRRKSAPPPAPEGSGES